MYRYSAYFVGIIVRNNDRIMIWSNFISNEYKRATSATVVSNTVKESMSGYIVGGKRRARS